MSMTPSPRQQAPGFIRRAWANRDNAPERVNRDHDVLRNVSRDIAEQHPNPVAPATFTEQLAEFATGADGMMKKLQKATEDTRTLKAENAILRAANDGLEEHVDRVNDYWERQYETVNAERQRLSRLYYSIVSRLDGAAEFIINTRDSAKKEAFAPDETQEPQRPNLDRAHPRTQDAAAAVEEALRRPGANRLPPPDYGQGEHGHPARRDIETGQRGYDQD